MALVCSLKKSGLDRIPTITNHICTHRIRTCKTSPRKTSKIQVWRDQKYESGHSIALILLPRFILLPDTRQYMLLFHPWHICNFTQHITALNWHTKILDVYYDQNLHQNDSMGNKEYEQHKPEFFVKIVCLMREKWMQWSLQKVGFSPCQVD